MRVAFAARINAFTHTSHVRFSDAFELITDWTAFAVVLALPVLL
jgi:hypothetical protein